MTTKRVFKTTKSLTLAKTYRKWEDWKQGDLVIGTICGTHKDKYDKDCRIIKVVSATFADKNLERNIVGRNLVLNSTGKLDKALEALKGQEDGVMIQVIFLGTNIINNPKHKFNGKEAHDIDVQIVEEDLGEECDETMMPDFGDSDDL